MSGARNNAKENEGARREHARRVSYWLIPSEPDKTRLAKIIASLSRQFEAPNFEPHVTLYAGTLAASENVKQIMAQAIHGISEITLQTAGISHSESFTKTLCMDFAENECLSKLSLDLGRHSFEPMKYELKPHLSLLYATVASELKEQLARDLMVPSRIHFDSIAAKLAAIAAPVPPLEPPGQRRGS